MKKLIIISLISLLLPFFSLAQVIVNQPYHYNLSNSDGLNSLTKPGGKKKKPAPKKDAKADPKKENKQDVKNEAVKSTKKDPKKGKKAKKKQKKEVSDYDWNFFAGPDMAFAFPLGRLRDSVNNGVGFNVRAEYFYTPELKLGLWTGYKSCKYDPVMVGVGHFTYIPIKLAATYYFSDGAIRPYANFGLGLYLIRQKYDAEFWTMVRNPQTNKVDTIYEKKHLNEKQNKFGFSPSIGVLYNIQDEFFINVNMSYEMILTAKKPSNLLGINLGLLYRFGF